MYTEINLVDLNLLITEHDENNEIFAKEPTSKNDKPDTLLISMTRRYDTLWAPTFSSCIGLANQQQATDIEFTDTMF